MSHRLYFLMKSVNVWWNKYMLIITVIFNQKYSFVDEVQLRNIIHF